MTNTKLLNEFIQKSGFKKGYLAKELNVTRSGFLLKLNNKNEFKASEIKKLCTLLDINIEDMQAIFFAQDGA